MIFGDLRSTNKFLELDPHFEEGFNDFIEEESRGSSQNV